MNIASNSAHHEKLPYYKINWFINKWVLCGGAEGCEIALEAELSSDKPPPLPEQPKASPETGKPAPKPETLQSDRYVNLVERILDTVDAFSRFKAWLTTPAPRKPPKQATLPKESVDIVHSFDIQEIPATMRKLNMPTGAKLME